MAPTIFSPGYSLTDADVVYDASEGCTFTSSVASAHSKTINPGSTQSGIGKTKITTKCVNSTDHQIYAVGYSNDTDGNTNLINSSTNATIATGTATSGNVSNWAMQIAKDTSSYLPANLSIVNSFGSYHAVPSTSTQISSYSGATDNTTGSSITTTYRAKISNEQIAGSYVGKVKYTLTATMVYSVTIKTVTGISKVTLNGVECTSTSGCTVNNLTEGESYNLVATLATGYNFASWNAGTNGSIANTSSASTTYTVGNGDSAVTPSATPKTYAITLNGNGATTAGSPSTTATYNNSSLSAITIPQRKYTISGFTIPASNNASGATVSSTSTLTSTYTFNGWYKENGATNKIANNAATPVLLASTSYTNGDAGWTYDGTRTLYAGWTAQAKTLPTITKTGYSCGWTETNTGASSITWASGASLTPAKNYTLYGVCVPVDYTITVSAGRGIESLSLDGWTGTGTGTLTKIYHIGDTIDLSAFTATYKTAYSGYKYSKSDSVGSLTDSTYTVGAGNGNITINATDLETPVCTVSGGSGSKVYNYSSTTITATSNSANYDMNSVNITYSFGYGTSASNTLGNFGTAQTDNTTVVAKNAFKGSRYYGVKVVVTDKSDNTITATCTSGTGTATGSTVAARTTISLVNSIIRFDATTNGGTLEGTTPLYVSYQGTDVYTSRTNSTKGTIPTAIAPAGYTFDGWYTEATSGSKVLNADNSFTGVAVTSWTNANSQWVKTSANISNETINILYAQYAPITYTITLNGNGATTAGSTSTTVASGATKLSSITKPFRSYTISGFTLPASNLADGASVSSSSTVTSSYTFNGWYKESETTNKIASSDTTPVLQASTSYTNESGQWTSTSGQTLYAGWTAQQKTLPTITKPGYTCGWTETSTGATSITYASGAKLTPGKNYTLYGVCTINNYTITVNAGVGINTLTLDGWTGSDTGTLTKSYAYGETIDLSTFVPDYLLGHSGKTYVKNDSYGSISSSTYTVGAGDGNITIKASTLATPTCTMQGGTTKIYNRSATTLTATDTSDLYESNSVDITYSFGYATAADGTLGNFGTAQAGNTLSIAKAAFYGARYYGVTVNVTSVDDSTLTATCTSGTGSSTGTTVANRTTMTLVNSRVQLNENGGTISGTAYFYVAYGKANKYSSRTSTSAYTLPTVTPPEDYVLDGWYTAAEGGSKVMNADFSLTGTAVSGWSNASSNWVKTGTSNSATATANILYAHYTFNGTYIQNLPSASCTSTPLKVYDNRDMQTYTVQRLADGNCWMMDNLDLGRTDLTTDLTSSNTNLSTTVTAATFNGWRKTSSSSTFTAGEFISLDGTDATSGTPYGTLYNYYAASAGTVSGEDHYSNAEYDICPAGWRLPTATDYGEFSALYDQYNSSALMRAPIAESGAAFALAGYFTSQTPSFQGSYGYYWSSSATANRRYKNALSIGSTVSANNMGLRSWGYSIRCILKNTSSPQRSTLTVSYDEGIAIVKVNGQVIANGETISLERGVPYPVSTTVVDSYRFDSYSVTSGTILRSTYYVINASDDTLVVNSLWNGLDIQNLLASNCTSNPRLARDNRDGHIYTIKRLNDGNCWMIENLDLGRTTLTADLTSANTNIATTVTAATFNSWKKTSGTGTYDAGEFINVTGTDSTSGTPYGTLYNYYAASAGTISGSSNSSNAEYDICPAGWRLPTGGDSGEFQALYAQYNSAALMRAPIANGGAAFALAGRFGSSTPGYQDSYGNYWSSTMSIDTSMYGLRLNTSDVYPANGYARYVGYAIRCVLKKPTHTLTVSYGVDVTNIKVNGITMQNGGMISLEEGVAYSITMTPATSYIFSAWSATSGTVGSTNTQATTYTIGSSNATLTASASFNGPNIQNLSSDSCTTTPSHAKDVRDNHIYTIQRLYDGNCWMMENLDLGRTTLNTDLTSANTNLATTVTASTFNSWKKTSGTGTYDAGEFINVTGTDSTSGTPYGTLYNYYAASVGTISGSSNSSNAEYDICPAGWRLPTGGDSGEFQTLYTQYNSNALMRAPIASAGAAFALAGGFDSSTPANQGINSRYWSSTRLNSTSMYYMLLNTSSVYPASSRSRYGGGSIRCVLDESKISDLTYMQDFATLSNAGRKSVLSSMTTGTQYQLRDSRDNKYYYIAKLADGNAWMTQNLDLDLSTGTTLTPANTDIPANWTPSSSTYTNSSWNYTTTAPQSYNPGTRYWNGNTHSGSGSSTSYISTSGTAQYHLGNYYNWSAAVALNDSSSYTTAGVIVDRSICPAGWTLPRGGYGLSTYYSLLFNYSGNAWLSPTYFTLSGTWSGSYDWVGYSGAFWATGAKSDGRAFYVDFMSDGSRNVGTGGYDRDMGLSVRCIARPVAAYITQ